MQRQSGLPLSGGQPDMPAIAQLVEHLAVECCSHQMVPGSIPGGRIDPGVQKACAHSAPVDTQSNSAEACEGGSKMEGCEGGRL